MSNNDFVFIYDDRGVKVVDCVINTVTSASESYNYLTTKKVIHNINIKIPIQTADLVIEFNRMINYFNYVKTFNDGKSLHILGDRIVILCKNPIIENLEMENVSNFGYGSNTNYLKMNIISDDISMFDNPNLYHRKLKLDKILSRMNGKEKAI